MSDKGNNMKLDNVDVKLPIIGFIETKEGRINISEAPINEDREDREEGEK